MDTTKHNYLLGCLIINLLIASPHLARGGSATWQTSPRSSNWNTASNWTPATVPNGSGDVASFGTSAITDITFSAATVVDSAVFNAGASAFTFSANSTDQPTLTFEGAGIINNSGVTQTFATETTGFAGDIDFVFSNSASAGSVVVFNGNVGAIDFDDTSTAGSATFSMQGATGEGGIASALVFNDNATAGDATIVLNPSTSPNASGPLLTFAGAGCTAGNAHITLPGATAAFGGGGFLYFDAGTAGNAVITISSTTGGGAQGDIFFNGSSSAGSAIITAAGVPGTMDGPGILFYDETDASMAQLVVTGNAYISVGGHAKGSPLGFGSLSGDGMVTSIAQDVTIGALNLDTEFSGIITSSAGGLIKVGTGNLTLSGANTYTGGTMVEAGTLTVNNTTGEGTGSGPLTVLAGRLAGNGIIHGNVSILGSGGARGILAPGGKATANLTLNSMLTMGSSSIYLCSYRGRGQRFEFDEVTADGVTLMSGTRIRLRGKLNGSLPLGSVFTVINNTSSTPISGVFANLADGATVAISGGNVQANYEGGDGNDLTLTVVP